MLLEKKKKTSWGNCPTRQTYFRPSKIKYKLPICVLRSSMIMLHFIFLASQSTAPQHRKPVPVCSIFSRSCNFGYCLPDLCILHLLFLFSLPLIHKSLLSTNLWPGPAQILPPKFYGGYINSYLGHINFFLQSLMPLIVPAIDFGIL